MALKDVGNKVPIYKLKTTSEVMKYYDEWGEQNKYNKDMVEWNYTGPQETVQVFRKYEMNKEAFNILEKYYPEGEFNESRQRMAKMPSDVQLIYNPMTAAPGFILNNVYVLPGVPKIMEVMFINILKNIKKGKPKNVITLNTNLYESKLAPYLNDIQKKYQECSIGSYPYFNFLSKTGGVNISISSWTMDSLDDVVKEISEMIKLNGGNYSVV